MPKYLIAILLAFFLLQSGWTQEDDDSSDEQPTSQVDAPDAATAEDVDDGDLDEQTYEEDDDDFVPTEEIRADEPIPFPSNI